jgi:hypothetical protein
VPVLKSIGEKTIMLKCVDSRLSRKRETPGRIGMFWNRAKHVEVYERAEASLPWTKTEEYIASNSGERYRA